MPDLGELTKQEPLWLFLFLPRVGEVKAVVFLLLVLQDAFLGLSLYHFESILEYNHEVLLSLDRLSVEAKDLVVLTTAKKLSLQPVSRRGLSLVFKSE